MDISTEEMTRRYARLLKTLSNDGFKALLVIGTANSNGNAAVYGAGTFRYLSDFYIMTLYGVLVICPPHDPAMFVPTELSRERGTRVSWVKDVRHSLDYGADVAGFLEECEITDGKVGIINIESIPARLYTALCERLPEIDFVDGSSAVIPSRFIKSEEERGLIAKSAEINDQAFQKVLDEMQPGMKEFEVVNIVESCQRSLGADGLFNLISSGPFGGGTQGRARLFHASRREIKRGDSVSLEVSCSYGGYWSQLVRAVSVGVADPDAVQMQKAAMATLKRGLDELCVGMRVREYFDIMAKEAGLHGFKLATPMGHFVGLDLMEARIDDITDLTFEPDMAFIVHPHLIDSRGRWLLWGHTFIMTKSGAVSLHRTEETGQAMI